MSKNFIEIYDEISPALCAGAADVFNTERDEARHTLERVGFPSAQDENYLHSRFSEIVNRDYGINANRLKFPINPEKIFHCAVPGINSNAMFVVNDMLYGEAKETTDLVMCSMETACEKYAHIVEKHFGKNLGMKSMANDAFTALNKMFAQDGYFIYVPKGAKVELPLQIINIMRSDVDYMASARNLIVVEDSAELHILVCDHTADSKNFFANRQTEVFVGNNAHLHYYNVESTNEKMCNLSALYVDQEANSRFIYSTLGLTNGNTRNEVVVNLNGEGCEVTLGGMLVSDKQQHTDNHTVINHNAANCTSTELYKYILDEEAKAIFSGLVEVKEGAQNTLAQQTNRNIILTPTAQVFTKPQLIIYADDVKCGHGATTGQLDEKAMFYMQQRGIGRNEARMLLLSAFAADVINLVEIEALRERLRMMIERRLRGEKNKCSGCSC